jgi:hypothetical protein
MTVCIAAICDRSWVLGVSDRMLTSGDIQAQPKQSKIVPLSNAIFAMYSGDVTLATDLLAEITRICGVRIRQEPGNWWRLQDVAALWRKLYLQRKTERAEANFLSPLGLTSESFIEKQRSMSENIAQQVTTRLLNYTIEDVEVIFAGIDPTGAHLFVARNEHIECVDGIGFAAIGSGRQHAISALTFAGYTRDASGARAVSCLSIAKLRAETAPGVGPETDTFMVLDMGRTDAVHDTIMADLRKACVREEKRAAEVYRKLEQVANNTLEKVRAARDAGQAEQAGPVAPAAPGAPAAPENGAA